MNGPAPATDEVGWENSGSHIASTGSQQVRNSKGTGGRTSENPNNADMTNIKTNRHVLICCSLKFYGTYCCCWFLMCTPVLLHISSSTPGNYDIHSFCIVRVTLPVVSNRVVTHGFGQAPSDVPGAGDDDDVDDEELDTRTFNDLQVALKAAMAESPQVLLQGWRVVLHLSCLRPPVLCTHACWSRFLLFHISHVPGAL